MKRQAHSKCQGSQTGTSILLLTSRARRSMTLTLRGNIMKARLRELKICEGAHVKGTGQIMSGKNATMAIFLATVSFAAFSQTLPSLKMQCINPKGNVKFTSVQHTQASTEPVQFNVNIPAGRGTIFVDKNNNGICTATISDGFQFTGGGGEIDETQISVSDPHKPSDLIKAINISTTILGNQKMVFSVSRTNDAIKGNLNIHFIARYKAD
nr:hypothetical protein [Massilia sp. JS1662]